MVLTSMSPMSSLRLTSQAAAGGAHESGDHQVSPRRTSQACASPRCGPGLQRLDLPQACSKVIVCLLAGDTWAHAATSRVILYLQGDQRMAFLYKSPSLPSRAAEYVITGDGVRGRRQHKRSHQEASGAAAH